MPASPLATTLMRTSCADLLVVGQHAVGVGDQDPLAAVAVAGDTCTIAAPADAGGLVDALQQRDLRRPCGTSSG